LCCALGLVSSVRRQEIGREERLRSDLFCVEWDAKTLTRLRTKVSEAVFSGHGVYKMVNVRLRVETGEEMARSASVVEPERGCDDIERGEWDREMGGHVLWHAAGLLTTRTVCDYTSVPLCSLLSSLRWVTISTGGAKTRPLTEK